jgi:hypothetical protein
MPIYTIVTAIAEDRQSQTLSSMPCYLLRLADVGGLGGSLFDHRQQLIQQGLLMGCGSSPGVQLSSMRIERHRVLSHLQATYSSCADASTYAPVRVADTGNIRSTADGKLSLHVAGV